MKPSIESTNSSSGVNISSCVLDPKEAATLIVLLPTEHKNDLFFSSHVTTALWIEFLLPFDESN
jgi:hypothetical protein